MQRLLLPLPQLQLNLALRLPILPLVQAVMTQHLLHLLIRKDHLKQLPLQLILQLRLPHLPAPWLPPQPLPPVLLQQLAQQQVLPVQQELPVEPVAVPVVAVDHLHLHQVRVVVQRVPKAKKAKARARESQNL